MSKDYVQELNQEVLDDLNGQTAKIGWDELARHYARGIVVKVEQGMDLVDVALQLINDNKEQFEQWINDGKVDRATDEDAKQWTEHNSVFWAVVAAPWILVQEIEQTKH